MTVRLFFQLLFGVFSFQRKNMRWFNFRRIAVVFFGLPFFLVVFVINQCFLLLDYLLFPVFLWQKLSAPVFIISAPRSATTFLYHSLANTEHFTCFKLWEIIFAPSICQKYLIVGLRKIDRLMFSPMKKSVLFFEHLLIGKLKKIHLIGLDLPEEDEAVLLWSLSTFYLHFFYPDSNYFDAFILFDKDMPEKRKKRIMRQYKRYLQRHTFVFNRKGNKRFLSKNPLMMPKVAALSLVFPDAQIININRCPAKTLPSTIGLNNTLYGLFTSRKASPEINARMADVLVHWYQLCENKLQKHYKDQHIKVAFRDLIAHDEQEIAALASFLSIPEEDLPKRSTPSSETHKSKHDYTPMSPEELHQLLEKLPFLKPYCER